MTPRRKLLVLTTTFPREPGDGTPEFVLSLSRHLAEEYDVTVATPRVPGSVEAQTLSGVQVIRFRYFIQRWEGLADGAILPNLRAAPWRIIEVPFLLTSMMLCALRVAIRRRPDIVHAHWIIPGGLVAVMLYRLLGIPYILTVHGADVYGLRGRAYVWLRNFIVRHAATVMPVSQDLAERLGSARNSPTFVVLPMGTDIGSLGAPARSETTREVNQFLFVGRLAEKKGVDVLLRACAEATDAKLWVVGSGPEEQSLRQLVKDLSIDDRVTFLGHRTQAEVRSLLARTSALIIPSRPSPSGDQEGTPVVLAEGVIASTPIIASSIGGLAERLENECTGLLVEPGSVEQLASALRYASMHSVAMQRMGDEAYRRLSTTLDMRTTAKGYSRIIRSILA